MDYALSHGNNTNGERFKCVCGLSAGNSGKSVVSKSKGSGQPVLFLLSQIKFPYSSIHFFCQKKWGCSHFNAETVFFTPKLYVDTAIG